MTLNLPVSFPFLTASVNMEKFPIRAYSDPAIFRSDAVLRTLVKREAKMGITTGKNYFHTGIQSELKPQMRKELAAWMLEICEEECCQPEVFCLAINYLDRFLSVCPIRRSQLQLLGSVCLLVSWKVRSHSTITAAKLIEFTDYNVALADLLEWEFLLLSKLDWDLSAVIAPDFVEHIIQRLLKLDLAWNPENTRKNSETLIYLCYSHLGLSSYPPSLIAVASIMTTLRPSLEHCAIIPPCDTPSPSSSSSGSANSSPAGLGKYDEPLDKVIEALQKITLVEKHSVISCMDELEQLMQASLPPSPVPSDVEAERFPHTPHRGRLNRNLSSSTPVLTSRKLYRESSLDMQNIVTRDLEM